ncbi:hypothetical protein [Emticicia sp. 17c]|uniref:hypothetical protein n=1 Tax=Emticicia sp. 17c TaxID=3127704 RepID=UPI00301D4577
MIQRLSIFILFLIIECSTFSEYIKDFFGDEITCNMDTCESDENESENKEEDKKVEANKYLISFSGINFTFNCLLPKKNIYFFAQASERFPIQLIQSPPPKI